jgi:hypothetical protein
MKVLILIIYTLSLFLVNSQKECCQSENNTICNGFNKKDLCNSIQVCNWKCDEDFISVQKPKKKFLSSNQTSINDCEHFCKVINNYRFYVYRGDIEDTQFKSNCLCSDMIIN